MPIDPGTVHALEAALAEVPDVLGAVVLDHLNEATPLEVQTFVRDGADLADLRPLLHRVAARVTDREVEVVVLEAVGPATAHTAPAPATASPRGPEPATAPPATTPSDDAPPAATTRTATGERPAIVGRRPRLVSVVLDSSFSADRHEAHVSLQADEVSGGRAVVGRDPLIAVVAAACDALTREGQDVPAPRAVQRVSVDGLDVLVVVVTVRGRPLVGTTVLDDEPEPAAAVRATLDAVNRWYGLG